MRHAVFMLDCSAQVLARTLRWLFSYSIFSSFIFFLAFLPLPFCTFGQRSRRTLAWTRIGNNLLCLTAGMYVCRHAPTPTPATPRGWRMHNSYFRVARLVAASPFSPFWHFSNGFFPISFRAEHLNSLAVLVMKLFVNAPLSTGRNASRGMQQREVAGTRFKLKHRQPHVTKSVTNIFDSFLL